MMVKMMMKMMLTMMGNVGNVEFLVCNMEIIMLLIIWNILERDNNDHNTDNGGNHDADHGTAYAIVGKMRGSDSGFCFFQVCRAFFCRWTQKYPFLHFEVKIDI